MTLLRLRAETVENHQERDKMLATISEMDSMIDMTLQFARDDGPTEGRTGGERHDQPFRWPA